jgi:uncharacterized protein YndB with AHSA1/START domain
MDERLIRAEVTLEAPILDVWKAWTTEEGVTSFFGPGCNLDLRPGGKYEVLFNLDVPAGDRGGEGVIVLAVQEPTLLSLTWNAPPELPEVRGQKTHVVVRLRELQPERTQVSLTHDGWGQGGEWDEAFAYFERAWRRVVLPRLKYRFAVGPVDWAHRPDLAAYQ